MGSLDLLLEGRLKELEQQELLSLVGGVVVEGEDHRVHELGGLVLGHLEDELGQVGWVGLRHTGNAMQFQQHAVSQSEAPMQRCNRKEEDLQQHRPSWSF